MIAYAAHGLFNNLALARIAGAPALTDVVVTNTVPLRDEVNAVHLGHKIVQLSVAPVLAQAMLRVQMGQSLAPLRAYEIGGGGLGGAGPADEAQRYEGQE